MEGQHIFAQRFDELAMPSDQLSERCDPRNMLERAKNHTETRYEIGGGVEFAQAQGRTRIRPVQQ